MKQEAPLLLETVYTHFVYYKIDTLYKNKLKIINPDLLRYDTQKRRLNNENINNLNHNNFIRIEYNNIFNLNGINDNLNYKVIFCYYRLI
jgi:hypothetical protein